MKALKIGFTLFSLLVMVAFANAQSANKQSIKEKTEHYIQALNLNDQQTAQARELGVKYEDLMANAATPVEKKKYRVQLDNEIKTILTDEQYSQYKEMVSKERREQTAMRKTEQ